MNKAATSGSATRMAMTNKSFFTIFMVWFFYQNYKKNGFTLPRRQDVYVRSHPAAAERLSLHFSSKNKRERF
jgi:hypothetical protein